MRIGDLQQTDDIISAVESMQDAGWRVQKTDRDGRFARLTKGRVSVTIDGYLAGLMNRTVKILLAGYECSKMVSKSSNPESLVMHVNRADKILNAADAIENNFEGSWRSGWPRPMYVAGEGKWTCVFFNNTVDVRHDDIDVSISYLDDDIAVEVISAADEIGWPRR